MLGANRSVTIVNSWYDGASDTDREVSTTLDGVSTHFVHSASTSSSGVTASDLAKVRIPFREGYLPEDQWIARQKSDRQDKAVWTLRVGDAVLVGGQRKTILRWTDNTDRPFSPHWYVEAQ